MEVVFTSRRRVSNAGWVGLWNALSGCILLPSQNGSPSPALPLYFSLIFFHPSTFHIVLWLLKTLALESALGLLINAPKLPLLPSSFHSPHPPSHFLSWKVIAKLRKPTHSLFEDVAVSIFLCPVTWVSSLPGFQLPCPKPPQYTHHCHLCFVIYYLPFILLEECFILSEFSKETKPMGLAHIRMTAGKSQDLQPENWGLRITNGVFLVWVWSPENQKNWWYNLH